MVRACKVVNTQKHPDTARSRCPPHPLGGRSTGSSTGWLARGRAPPAGSPPEDWLPGLGEHLPGRLRLRHLEKPVRTGRGPAAPQLGAGSEFRVHQRVNVKMYQLVSVSIAMAERAGSKSKEDLHSVLSTVKTKLHLERGKMFQKDLNTEHSKW